MARQMALLGWRALKAQRIRIVILPICSLIVGITTNILVIPTSIILSCLFSVNTFSVEEKSTLSSLYLTLPVQRKYIVAGRFWLSIAMGLFGLIISIPLMLLANQFSASRYYGPLDWYISIIAISYLLFALLNLSTFPILFKKGYNKGRFWGHILPFIFVCLLYGAFAIIQSLPGNQNLLFNMLEYASKNKLLISGGMALLATILLFASYFISKCIYEKRDF